MDINKLVVFSLLLVASLLDSFFGSFFDHWIIGSLELVYGAVGDSQYPVNPSYPSNMNISDHISMLFPYCKCLVLPLDLGLSSGSTIS